MLPFYTDYRYHDRQTKARYVWLKYRPILEAASILDVGADECYLKSHLDGRARYWGIGLGGHPDQQVDLETGRLPFGDRSFDCVLSLDVLEHIERIHELFDEVCRVARRHVILSLPNPWGDFWRMLRRCGGPREAALKYYGLPLERPVDRHRWFFSEGEARRFVEYRARKNGFCVMQMDNGPEKRRLFRYPGQLRQRIQTWVMGRGVQRQQLYAGSLWGVLARQATKERIAA